MNNLQTLPVYSLRLYSRQTTRRGGEERGREEIVLSNGEGERKKDWLFGKTAVRREKKREQGGC